MKLFVILIRSLAVLVLAIDVTPFALAALNLVSTLSTAFFYDDWLQLIQRSAGDFYQPALVLLAGLAVLLLSTIIPRCRPDNDSRS